MFIRHYKSQQRWSVPFISVWRECTYCCILFWPNEKLTKSANVWMLKINTHKSLESHMALSKTAFTWMGEEMFRNGGYWRMVKLNVMVSESEWRSVYSARNLVSVTLKCQMRLWKPSQELLNKMDMKLKST
jgi:hypothetical protein